MSDATLIARLDALLPQTQCEKCGHPGCLPYATAMAAGEAHNKCPPGRQETADALARLLARPALPLDAKPEDKLRKVAVIREAECIGCTKCIDACPVDAIVGAPLLMHTVIAAECTGCDLCLPPCPVDCIDMQVLADQHPDPAAAAGYRRRFVSRNERLARQADDGRRARRIGLPRPQPSGPVPAGDEPPLMPPASGPSTAFTTDAVSSAGAATLARLQTLAATARRQHREASAALARAQRAGHGDLAAMQARVDALQARAEAAQQRLDAARAG